MRRPFLLASPLLLAPGLLALLTFACGGDGAERDGGDRDEQGRDAGRDAAQDTGAEDAADDPTRSDGDDGDGAAPGFTLAADPSSLSVLQGETGRLTVTLRRLGGFAGEVALSLVDPPGGIGGTFTPASADGTTSELALAVDLEAAIGTLPLTVRGTVAGLTAETTVMLEVQEQTQLDVSGTVVDLFGQPVPQLQVAAAGQGAGQVTSTDETGRFALTGVNRPYDLFVQGARSIVYLGLTGPTVRLAVPTTVDSAQTAHLEGRLTDDGNPLGPEVTSGVAVGGTGIASSSGGLQSGGDYALDAFWSDPAAQPVTVHAVAFNTVSGSPSTYLGYGSLSRTLESGSGEINVEIPLAQVNTGTVNGLIEGPQDFAVSWRVTADLGDGAFIPLGTGATPQVTSRVPTPAGATFSVFATATQGTSFSSAETAGLLPNAGTTRIALPPLPETLSPIDNLVGATLAEPLTWTPREGTVSVVGLPALGLLVVTDRARFDITSLDAGSGPLLWPAAGEVVWSLSHSGPFSSIDEAAVAGERLLSVLLATSTGVRAPVSGTLTGVTQRFRTVAQ